MIIINNNKKVGQSKVDYKESKTPRNSVVVFSLYIYIFEFFDSCLILVIFSPLLAIYLFGMNRCFKII